ncbi:DUF566 domain-containing protein [Cephalotus follicularis]|uniref:DUF566 domain-containing protein n=1 Tax=Cephalotus follicularis TaxID=3775 RepID=A0A1Q3BQG8_CEPFO|nr:DUF566 domain-containing protein [Cephalotus follicularis]
MMMVEEQGVRSSSETPAAPPPTTHRRPRVREVSSRFMSPASSPSSTSSNLASKSPLHRQQERSTSVHKQRRQLEFEPLTSADDNLVRNYSSTAKKHHHFHQEQPQRAGNKFKEKENEIGDQVDGGGAKQLSVPGRYANFTPSRPATPNPMATTTASMDRMLPSRFRLTTSTPAAKLLQSSGMSLSAQCKVNTSLETKDPPPSSSSSICLHDNSIGAQTLHDLRSSMPDPADMFPTVSNRLNNSIVGDSFSKLGATPCSRSLNLPLSKPVKVGGGPCLPPVAPYPRLQGTDARRGRKVSSHQEDVHSLRLLHNHYLQWRFANAKAELSMQARNRETERTLYSHSVKMSDLYDSVKRKRIELGLLQRSKILTTILEAQMPYLDEWSALEGEYSLSLSEVIQALLNASSQLPIYGNIRQVDLKEVGEALSCAVKLMETIGFHVQSFMPKAEELEISISELARVTGGERALIEECGDLLSRAYNSQVEECSLRSQLIQLHQFRKDER